MLDFRNVISHLQKYSLCFDVEGCSHCAEGCQRKHSDPAQHVNADEAVTICNVWQIYYGINVQGVVINS